MTLLAQLNDPTAVAAIKAHAVKDYPNEACGAITPTGYQPLNNLAADPKHSFECTDQVNALRAAGNLIALVHSHPDGPDAPSGLDIQQQIAFDIPWGLVLCNGTAAQAPWWWGDMLDPPPLLGRRFRHGPSGTDGKGDCYALIRDYYRIERKIILPDFPRDDSWWTKDGQDLYAANFGKAGFVTADAAHPEIGDVVLLQIGRAPVAQHAAIYTGGGRVLHHLTNRLSGEVSFVNWTKHIRYWLRFKALP